MNYEVWACYASGQEELLESFANEYEADFLCNELNIAASDDSGCADYRVCPRSPVVSKQDCAEFLLA